LLDRRLVCTRMTDPRDDKRFDFATRAFEQKGRAETHRLQAELATDPAMKALHTGAAAAYEAIANEIDRTAERIADIDRATARVRTRIAQRTKAPSSSGPMETVAKPQDPDRNLDKAARCRALPAHRHEPLGAGTKKIPAQGGWRGASCSTGAGLKLTATS
jgi:hypothetical protein